MEVGRVRWVEWYKKGGLVGRAGDSGGGEGEKGYYGWMGKDDVGG